MYRFYAIITPSAGETESIREPDRIFPPPFLFIFSSPKAEGPLKCGLSAFYDFVMSDFEFSDTNKRYHTLDYYNRHRGLKLFKAAVNCGFTCPNADGTKGRGGCIFCAEGSRLFTNDASLSVTQQLTLEAERIHRKNPGAFLCAYFQTNTNTYAPAEHLRKLYYEAAEFEGVREISVATRPDCLPEDVIGLLSELNSSLPVTVELGLQTVSDKTAAAINRGYDFAVFEEAFEKLKKNNIRTCVHIINGLPGETREDMLNTAQTVGKLSPGGMKIHLLYVAEGTRLADMFRKGEYTPLSLEEYADTVTEQLTYIPARTVIERITGDGDKRTLLAPQWSADKIRVLGTIDKMMSDKNYYQGQRTDEQ